MGIVKWTEEIREDYFNRMEERRAAGLPAAVTLPKSRNTVQVKKDPYFPTDLLKCRDCGNLFVLTTGEQQFFRRKGLTMPKRCKACRAVRRLELLDVC